MKKLTALILTVMLAAMWCLPALAVRQMLIQQNGVELELLEWSIQDSTGNPSIYLKFRGKNDTNEKVWVDILDATVDGVPVLSAPRSMNAHSEKGESDPILTSVWADEKDGGKGAQAIRNGKKLEFQAKISGAESYSILANEHVTINLKSTEDSTPKSTSNTDSQSKTNYAPAYTPASTNYTGLKKGSQGQAVKDLQQRLTDLGYLNDKVNGEYGLSTSIAVMSFCDQNGLYIQGDATPEMQKLLYSSKAEYYVEPWIPLIFGPEYKWDDPLYVDIDNGTFYIQLVNRTNRTIRGYELYYYFTDVWGNRYLKNGIELTMKTVGQESIKPGYCVYSIPITVYPFSWTYAVNIGIHKIIFDDGEIREIDTKEVNYWTCPIKN